MSKELRRLTVSHQKPGQCRWCDSRFAKILDAATRVERLHNAYDCNCGASACDCGCGECPPGCECPGGIEPGKLCECENG